MKKTITVIGVVLAILLVTNLLTYKYQDDKLVISYKTISNLEQESKKKSAEIANLENVLKSKNQKLEENGNLISELKFNLEASEEMIIKLNSSIESKDKEIKSLKSEVESAKLSFKAVSNTDFIKQKQPYKAVKQLPNSSKGNSFTVEASAYIAHCKEGCTGVTATGINVSNSIYYQGHRVIAVDKNVIPLHSLVEVNTGNEVFTAMAIDTGGAIRGNKIDVLVSTTQEALNFGRKNVSVTILKNGGK